jgi:ribosomal protein L7/L12
MTPAETFKEVVVLIYGGRPIEGIRLARDRFGLTLREAKDLVEAIGDALADSRRRVVTENSTALFPSEKGKE